MYKSEVKEKIKKAFEEKRYIKFSINKISTYNEKRVILFVGDDYFAHTNLETHQRTKPKRFFNTINELEILETVKDVENDPMTQEAILLKILLSYLDFKNYTPLSDEETKNRQISRKIKPVIEKIKELEEYSPDKEEFSELLNKLKKLFIKYL